MTKVYFYKAFYSTDTNQSPHDWDLIELCVECAAEHGKNSPRHIEQIDLAGQYDICINCGAQNWRPYD